MRMMNDECIGDNATDVCENDDMLYMSSTELENQGGSVYIYKATWLDVREVEEAREVESEQGGGIS